jgi:hypothetical protein
MQLVPRHRGAAQAKQGEVLTPRGGHTSWRHTPQMSATHNLLKKGVGAEGWPKSPRRSSHRRGGGHDDDSNSDDDTARDDFGRYEPRTTTEAQFGGGGGLARRSYGPGHSKGGRQRSYEVGLYKLYSIDP